MAYLLASIVCSMLVSVLLKVARKQKVNIEQAVTVNYIVAAILTMLVLRPDSSNPQVFLPTQWLFVALGILLPNVSVIMGKFVDAAGIVKSDAAQRLSLFLPVIASFALLHERLTESRLIGSVLAFTALFFLLWKSDGGRKSGGLNTQVVLLLGVWCGYGIVDILSKQVAKSGTVFAGNLLVVFCLATILMFDYLFAKGGKWTKENIIDDMVLGCLNFLSAATYISAHQITKDNPTLVFADVNISVTVLSMPIGAAMFKEEISSTNTAGVSIAICSVACLFYQPQIRSLIGQKYLYRLKIFGRPYLYYKIAIHASIWPYGNYFAPTDVSMLNNQLSSHHNIDNYIMEHTEKHIQCAVLDILILSGCQSYQEDQSHRDKIVRFALNHPVAAQVIGMEDEGLINMTSNATRFAEHTGLDDETNGDSRGTQINVICRTLWQAAIASKLDSIIAEKADNARLTDIELRGGKNDYFSRHLTGRAVDQRNNRIGRSIGSAKPDSSMKTLATSILFYYSRVDLWTASEVKNRWHIKQERFSDGQYAEALKNVVKLDQGGMAEQGRNSYKTGTLSEIKRSVRAVHQAKD